MIINLADLQAHRIANSIQISGDQSKQYALEDKVHVNSYGEETDQGENLTDMDAHRMTNSVEITDGQYKENSLEDNAHLNNYREIYDTEAVLERRSFEPALERSLEPSEKTKRRTRTIAGGIKDRNKKRRNEEDANNPRGDLFDDSPSRLGNLLTGSSSGDSNPQPEAETTHSSENSGTSLGGLLIPNSNTNPSENSSGGAGSLIPVVGGNSENEISGSSETNEGSSNTNSDGNDNKPSTGETVETGGEENEGGFGIPFLGGGSSSQESKPQSAKPQEAKPSTNSDDKGPTSAIPGFIGSPSIPFIGSPNKNNSSSSNGQSNQSGNGENSSSGLTSYIPGGLSPSSATSMIPGSVNPSTYLPFGSGSNSSQSSSSSSGGGSGMGGLTGLGSNIPGVSAVKDRIPGLGNSSSSQSPTLIMGAFGVVVVPLTPENMATAMSGVSQMGSMIPGGGLGGMSGMLPGLG